jgi:hypothetical protein
LQCVNVRKGAHNSCFRTSIVRARCPSFKQSGRIAASEALNHEGREPRITSECPVATRPIPRQRPTRRKIRAVRGHPRLEAVQILVMIRLPNLVHIGGPCSRVVSTAGDRTIATTVRWREFKASSRRCRREDPDYLSTTIPRADPVEKVGQATRGANRRLWTARRHPPFPPLRRGEKLVGRQSRSTIPWQSDVSPLKRRLNDSRCYGFKVQMLTVF